MRGALRPRSPALLAVILAASSGCYAAHDRPDDAGPPSPCRLEVERGACCASGCMWIGEVEGPGLRYRCVEREIPRCPDAGICARGTCTRVHSTCFSIDSCAVCMAAESDHRICL